jgi:predicted nucleotidyltransferase
MGPIKKDTITTSLGDALFTKTQQRVLGLLYGRPDKSFYTNEIVRSANMGRGTVKRELEQLVSAGLLVLTREGNQLHYQANPRCPIYNELLGIVKKTFGIADVIRSALLPFDAEIDLAFIYGSVAKGEETATSDIDLMVVSESIAYSELMVELANAEESLGRTINPTIYTMKEMKSKFKKDNAFVVRVMKQPKLWIKGSEDDVRKIGKPG